MSQCATESAVTTANLMYHGGSSVRSIARFLNVSRQKADRLIVYSREKWDERRALAGGRPLHFDEVVAVA